MVVEKIRHRLCSEYILSINGKSDHNRTLIYWYSIEMNFLLNIIHFYGKALHLETGIE